MLLLAAISRGKRVPRTALIPSVQSLTWLCNSDTTNSCEVNVARQTLLTPCVLQQYQQALSGYAYTQVLVISTASIAFSCRLRTAKSQYSTLLVLSLSLL